MASLLLAEAEAERPVQTATGEGSRVSRRQGMTRGGTSTTGDKAFTHRLKHGTSGKSGHRSTNS